MSIRLRFVIHCAAYELKSFSVLIWYDLIQLLCTVHPLLVVPLPTCLLYFTILAHKPSVRPSIVRFLIRRWVFVHGPLIERHLVQDCHIVKMVIEFRIFWQRTVMICVYLWAFHPIFRFSFWLTKLPKTKIGCMIFCTCFPFAGQDRQDENEKW